MTTSTVVSELDARIESQIGLAVGRSIEAGSDIHRLRLSEKVADGFRDYVRGARDRIANDTAVEYTALAELKQNEFFLLEDAESLEELSDLRAVVENVGDLAPLSPSELDASIGFYIVSVGTGAETIACVRRHDPRVTARTKKFFAIAQERLERIDEDVFAFSDEFDLVIGERWAVIFNQTAFERLARETGIVERRVSTWITGITDALPMEVASIDRLRETALRDSRTWRRLRDIKQRGHLKNVDLTQVAAYASSVDLDPDQVVRDGSLYFDPQERFGFLHLLSEDLYNGPLTGERFESQRKSSMGDA